MKKKLFLSMYLNISLMFAEYINLNPEPNSQLPPITDDELEKYSLIPKFIPLYNTPRLPVKVDNTTQPFFRGIFSQNPYGSCAQASAIGYVYTYESNFLNNTDANFGENRYPQHYTYNFLNFRLNGVGVFTEDAGSWPWEGWDIVKTGGCPNVVTYGGLVPPSNPEEGYIPWMSGYEKYKSAIYNNRVKKISKIKDINTYEGLIVLKEYLSNHGSGEQVGGIATFMTSMWGECENLPENSPYPGEHLIREMDNTPYHAMTFVGYDDNVCWDYNNDGKYTDDIDINGDGVIDLRDCEIGALLCANSYGSAWCNWGKIWMTYKTVADLGIYDNSALVIQVEKSNPKLLAKTKISYTKRNAIRILAGISNSTTTEIPDNLISYIDYSGQKREGFPHLNFQGGNYGMEGYDGEIEICLDLSNLNDYAIPDQTVRYFIGVEQDEDIYGGIFAGGEGSIEFLSIIDENGNEYTSAISQKPIELNGRTWVWVDVPYSPKTYYVNNDIGDDNKDGSSELTAFKTISKAVKEAGAGSTIILAGNSDEYPTAGTFTLSSPEEFSVVRSGIYSGLPVTKELHFIGQSPENTIVQSDVNPGVSTHRVFLLKSDESVDFTISFENLSIRNGMGEPGGGIFSYCVENITLKNCRIYDNYYWDDPDTSTSEFGGGGICVSSGSITIENCVIRDNQNNVRNGGAGLYCYLYDKREIKIINSSIINNSSSQSGGGIRIDLSVPISEPSHDIDIRNSTIANNFSNNGFGHGIYINCGIIRSDIDLNSCTIVDNFNPGEPLSGYGISIQALWTSTIPPPTSLNVSNSIIKNNANNYRRDGTIGFDRSYTICDDNSLPLGSDPQEFNELDPMITGIRNEEGTHYYKIIAGSPAKDAIPKGTDPSNPFNGAGNYITDDEGNPILDEYGNIQVLDQRGFNVWNWNKDIGAYESPYYWVDVTAIDDEYRTIPDWRTKLMIADPIEYESDLDGIWTDYMRAQTGGKIILSDNSELIREEGSELHWYGGSYMHVAGSSRIRYGSYFIENANVNIYDGAQLSLLNSNTAIPASASLVIGSDSRLILEGESTIVLGNGLNVESKNNAELLVYGPAKLIADGVSFSYTGTESGAWKGINGQTGSKIDLNNVNIVGALTGVSADTPQMFEVTKSTFEGCTNGIDLFGIQANSAYLITDNTLVGNDEGRGVIITGASTDGVFSRNKISHFNTGASFIMSSPAVSKCEFSYNKYYGILSSGREALPHLINTEQMQIQGELNCLLEKNAYASNTSLFPSAHIGIIPVGNIYMRNNDIISSPNFLGISIAQAAFINPTHILLDAQYNYWGAEQVTDDYFFGHSDYTIDYEPYYSAPCGTGTDPSLAQYASTESITLIRAISLESDGKIIAAIKLYELIIKKYVDTPEYYVAMARLPYLYEQAGLDNNELIATYDEAIDSKDVSHKKFFKGKKVATHIKGKRYDEAIAVAEEMKAEAEIEEEIILADINIAIANMLKENEGKGKNGTQIKDPRELISRLYGDEEKNNPSDITESVLPTQHELFQNYPNPFNPVTQIKFALAKTADVKLSVYNISGQKVAELANGSKQAGIHTVEFDGSRLNSGVYYYNLEVDGKNITKKMVLTK